MKQTKQGTPGSQAREQEKRNRLKIGVLAPLGEATGDPIHEKGRERRKGSGRAGFSLRSNVNKIPRRLTPLRPSYEMRLCDRNSQAPQRQVR